eukprot:4836308-Prymnesium_polylepis.1
MEVGLARQRSEPLSKARGSTHGAFCSAGRHGEGLMCYPLLVQTRMGNPDRLRSGDTGGVRADPRRARNAWAQLKPYATALRHLCPEAQHGRRARSVPGLGLHRFQMIMAT